MINLLNCVPAVHVPELLNTGDDAQIHMEVIESVSGFFYLYISFTFFNDFFFLLCTYMIKFAYLCNICFRHLVMYTKLDTMGIWETRGCYLKLVSELTIEGPYL